MSLEAYSVAVLYLTVGRDTHLERLPLKVEATTVLINFLINRGGKGQPRKTERYEISAGPFVYFAYFVVEKDQRAMNVPVQLSKCDER